MKRVFLGGTTTGTTWRQALIAELLKAGVRQEQIFNPHLPAGVKYTDTHKQREIACKNDPDTLIVIYVCPAVIPPTQSDSIDRAFQAERIGAISMFEAGRYAFSAPHRTAIVFDYEKFLPNGRSYRTLQGLAKEIHDVYGPYPPYFSSLTAVKNWLIPQLTA